MNTNESETQQTDEALMLETAIQEGDMAKQTEQGKMLREAREQLGLTNEELALVLGAHPRALLSWLLPAESEGYRPMNETTRMLLEIRMEQGPRKVANILKDLRRKS
jgi:DNA-binding XRE family transcriptional regulator